jgi:phosphocarrier protein HPr
VLRVKKTKIPRETNVQFEVTVMNKLGVHARPSAAITQVATRFKSEVWLTKNTRRVNAKSIMGVMMLAAAKGAKLQFDITGVDEQEAATALTELFASGFGEEI